VLAATTDAYLYFADAVKRDNLRFTLDTANQFVMKDSLVLSLHRLKDHIDYLHISDNGGLRVEHLALGEGVIAWEPFWDALEAIDYRGHIGIDIGGAESEVPQLKKAYLDAANEVERRLR
jgi:sugar phosphate isomerase/epimerase